jgi:formylmethanofuran dehydrogenase subunit E
MSRITVSEAARFHGHLGPYLILGILAGELAIKLLKCKKYFGLDVLVQGANKKPKSCLIDGLQLATGATYGKGNIKKITGNKVVIYFHNLKNNKKLSMILRKELIKRLNILKGHADSERLARELYSTSSLKMFDLNTGE